MSSYRCYLVFDNDAISVSEKILHKWQMGKASLIFKKWEIAFPLLRKDCDYHTKSVDGRVQITNFRENLDAWFAQICDLHSV